MEVKDGCHRRDSRPRRHSTRRFMWAFARQFLKMGDLLIIPSYNIGAVWFLRYLNWKDCQNWRLQRSCPANIGGTVAYPNKTAQFDSIFLAFTTQGGNIQSEDCLSANVWVKGKPKAGESKPVLVFLPGGSKLKKKRSHCDWIETDSMCRMEYRRRQEYILQWPVSGWCRRCYCGHNKVCISTLRPSR